MKSDALLFQEISFECGNVGEFLPADVHYHGGQLRFAQSSSEPCAEKRVVRTDDTPPYSTAAHGHRGDKL